MQQLARCGTPAFAGATSLGYCEQHGEIAESQFDEAHRVERTQLVPGGFGSTEPVFGQAGPMQVRRGDVGPGLRAERLTGGALDFGECGAAFGERGDM